MFMLTAVLVGLPGSQVQ